MIAIWMLYCLLCALGLCLAALLAERALLAGGGPVRHVWTGAVALSLLIPVAAFRYAPRPGAANVIGIVRQNVALDTTADSVSAVSPPAVEPARSPSAGWNWRGAVGKLARADRPLAIAWLSLSSALALYFFGGIIALVRMRRWWRRQVLLGVPVLVSERTGPALVGAVSPAIVVPEWAVVMEPAQLALMLRHEQEHQRAGDGVLLTVAQVALIAMPWNVALWWQLLRLRVAVELDCDARVLRDADARSYGDLLLEVARPRRGPRLMGATAFAERAAQLERRIRAMARRRERASRSARAVAAFIGLAAVTVAWAAPRPPAPARSAPPRVAPPLVAPSAERAAPAPTTPVANKPEVPRNAKPGPAGREQPKTDGARGVELSAAARSTTTRDSARGASLPLPVDTPPPSPPPPTGGGRGGRQGLPPFGQQLRPQDPAQFVDSVFHRLFDGIALTPDQESQARNLLTSIEVEQLAQNVLMMEAITTTFVRRAVLQAQGDSALRALLVNDADRAEFDARVASQPGGRGGRSGGPPPDSLGGGRGGRGGGGRGPGAGGRGPGRGTAIPMIVDATFHRLFDGIALTPDQEASARAALTTTQAELQALLPPPFPARLSMRPGSGLVVMQIQSDSALIALLTNDADRATLQSRIVVPIPPVRQPQQ